MPFATWHYKAQDAKYRHMGPMAQDFYSTFHLGESDTGIDTIDADRENAELKARVSQLEARAAKVDALEIAVKLLQHDRAVLGATAGTP